MAVLMAVLYSFTHLAADNEVTAMRASGVSVFQVVKPVFLVGLVVAVASFLFSDQVLPRSNAQLRNLLLNIGRKKPTFELREQVINELGPAGIFLRALRIDPNTGRMRDVTIYDMNASGGRRVVYADSGVMALTPDETDLSLRLFDGSVHQFKAAQPGMFQLTYFTVNDIRVKDITNQFEANFVEAVRGDREMSTCEMIGVIRSHERDSRQAELELEYFLARDLRALLGLRPPQPPGPVEAGRPGGYCTWFQKIGGFLSPKTAEAQEPAQEPRRPRLGNLREQVRARKLQADSMQRGLIPADSTLLIATPETGYPPIDSALTIQLTSAPEVANAATRAEDARKLAGKYAIEVHKKWSIAVACIVFVLVGVPMALRFPRGGMGLVLGGGLAVFSVYYIGLIAGEALGDRAIVNPIAAMWVSNGIFAVLGVIGLFRVSRESGSTRGGDVSELFDTLFGRFRRKRKVL
jgi:lipopolysaccharide export system permease protein